MAQRDPAPGARSSAGVQVSEGGHRRLKLEKLQTTPNSSLIKAQGETLKCLGA